LIVSRFIKTISPDPGFPSNAFGTKTSGFGVKKCKIYNTITAIVIIA
jgi:hypothetical protein